MSVKISQMVEIPSFPTNDTLIETAQPFSGDPPGFETFSVKTTGITRRFMFQGSIDPTIETSVAFLVIPVARIEEMLGYTIPSLSFIGIGSGVIEVSMATVESQLSGETSALRAGASKFNIIFNEGNPEMTYFITSEINSGGTMVPFTGPITNTSSTVPVFPVVSNIYVSNIEGVDSLVMEMALSVDPYITLENTFGFYGYADVNLIFKYGIVD